MKAVISVAVRAGRGGWQGQSMGMCCKEGSASRSHRFGLGFGGPGVGERGEGGAGWGRFGPSSSVGEERADADLSARDADAAVFEEGTFLERHRGLRICK